MATSSNSRDVTMTLSVETLGDDNIKKLQAAVNALAKQGGDAGPAFEKLADEIGRIEQQSKALKAFSDLSAQTADLQVQQEKTAASAAELRGKLELLAQATTQASARQEIAATKLDEARTKANQLRDDLARLKAKTDETADSAATYTSRVQKLTLAKIDQRVNVEALTAELKRAKVETDAAEKAEERLANAMSFASSSADKAAAALRENVEQTRHAANAAQELGVNTENVAAAQASLIQALNATKAAADGLETSVEQLAETAKTAKLAGQEISNAFHTLGIRSANELEAEIAQVRAAMETVRSSAGVTGRALNTAFAAGEAKIEALNRELRQVTGALTLADRAAGLLKNSLGQISAGNLIADGIGYLVNQVKEMGRAFFAANLDIERLTRTMTVITGSVEGAAQKIDFLRKVANTSGQAISEISTAFIRFQASASTAGLAADDVDQIFKAVAVSGSKMGISSDRVALALDALGQIASKGTVTMEELRQQLGDSLPGSLAIAARGLGRTTSELVKLVETGQVSAAEFFPAFKRGLEETFGSSDTKVEGLAASINRLKNAFDDLYKQAAGSAAFRTLEAVLNALAANLGSLVNATFAFGQALAAIKIFEYVRGLGSLGVAATTAAANVATQTVATVANTAATAINTTAKAANTAATIAQSTANAASAAAASVLVGGMNVLTGSLTTLGSAARTAFNFIGGLPGLLVITALNARELGTALGESAAKLAGWGKVLDEANRKLEEQAAAERALIDEKKRAIAVQEQQIVRQTESFTAARQQLEAEVATSKKATDAAQERANVIERIAALYGSQAESIAAASAASVVNAEAAKSEALAKAALVTALEEEIAQKELLIASSKNVSEKIREELLERQNQLATMKEVADQSALLSQRANIEAADRKIVAEAYKDNSEKVDQYRAAMDAARVALQAVQELEAQGLPVKKALAAAELDLATNTRLYTDALNDKLAKLNAGTAAQRADIELSNAGLSVRLAQLRSMEESARAHGNETAAIYAKIEQKRIEIQIIEATTRATVIEQEGIIQTARLKLDEAKQRGTLTDLMRMELETAIKLAEAKILEAKARGESTSAIEREIRLLKDGTKAREADTKSRGENTTAINRQTAALEKQLLTSDGFKTNKDGSAAGQFESTAPINDAVAISDKLADGTLGAGDLAAAQSAVNQARTSKARLDGMNQAFVSLDAQNSAQALVRKTEAALARVKSIIAAGGTGGGLDDLGVGVSVPTFGEGNTGDGGLNVTPTPARNKPVAPSPSPSKGARVITINIGGRSTAVKVASDADADALTAILRQLESAAGASA